MTVYLLQFVESITPHLSYTSHVPQYDIAKVAALLHRAADLEEVPTMKEVKYLLPKPALTVRDVKPPQWVNMVQSAWPEVASLTSLQAKAQVLGAY